MTCPLASDSEVPQTACVKERCGGGSRRRRRRKINRFLLSGWAVSLACQWSCYSGGTRGDTGPTLDLLLTRGKTCWQAPGTSWNTDLHFKRPSEEASRKATARRGGPARLGWGAYRGWVCVCVRGSWWVGGGDSQPASSLLSDCLALYHKCFYPPINYSPLVTPKEKSACTDCGWGEILQTYGPACSGHSCKICAGVPPPPKKKWTCSMHVNI